MKSEFLDFLRSVDTATVANAIETLKLRPRTEGFPSLDLRCLFPELGVMCGYAVTAQALLHGDENGIITIPEEKRGSLKTAVEKVFANERKLLDFVRQDDFR